MPVHDIMVNELKTYLWALYLPQAPCAVITTGGWRSFILAGMKEFSHVYVYDTNLEVIEFDRLVKALIQHANDSCPDNMNVRDYFLRLCQLDNADLTAEINAQVQRVCATIRITRDNLCKRMLTGVRCHRPVEEREDHPNRVHYFIDDDNAWRNLSDVISNNQFEIEARDLFANNPVAEDVKVVDLSNSLDYIRASHGLSAVNWQAYLEHYPADCVFLVTKQSFMGSSSGCVGSDDAFKYYVFASKGDLIRAA